MILSCEFWPLGALKSFFLALAQLTDKIDPKYIIPKDWPEPHDDAHVICFLGVTKFVHQGAKKLFFWALSQLTDKMDPMYIIPK